MSQKKRLLPVSEAVKIPEAKAQAAESRGGKGKLGDFFGDRLHGSSGGVAPSKNFFQQASDDFLFRNLQ